MHSGGWWEDHQVPNGLFCTYYILSSQPGIQEVMKFTCMDSF